MTAISHGDGMDISLAPTPAVDPKDPPRILNDEPARVDQLDRLKLARALASTAERCETPLVLGLYGTWGNGKTSLMQIMEEELLLNGKVIPIWFDAWQHQFDENPVVALLHKMVEDLGMGEDGRKLLHVIAGAFGALLLNATTNLNTSELRELSDRYDEERFLIREKQIRLREHFAKLLEQATNAGEVRLVFFIDDLDRCVPEQVLRVLEALKLFLNMPGCVYVLGVDRVALESSIRHRYENKDVSEAEYLDKIVQLPFSIPPIASEAMTDFVKDLLPSDLHPVIGDLVEGLGENPRQVKRFVNSLILNHELAHSTLADGYDPGILAAVLLLQYRKPDFFKQALRDPAMLTKLPELIPEDEQESWMRQANSRLETLAPKDLAPYMYLSEAATVRNLRFDVVLTDLGSQKVPIIKVLRKYTGLGLKESKALTDEEPPTVVHAASNREEAERMVAELEESGGRAEVQ